MASAVDATTLRLDVLTLFTSKFAFRLTDNNGRNSQKVFGFASAHAHTTLTAIQTISLQSTFDPSTLAQGAHLNVKTKCKIDLVSIASIFLPLCVVVVVWFSLLNFFYFYTNRARVNTVCECNQLSKFQNGISNGKRHSIG